MVVRILVTASGGGHTGYGVSIAQRLHGKVDELVFIIPRGDKWTRSKVEKYSDGIIEISKPRGPRDSMGKLLLRMPGAFIESLRRVPGGFDVFISSGSNHSVPPAIVARFKGMRVYNLESSVRFTRPSLSAKWLRPFSHVTVLQWEEQLKIHPKGRVYGPFYEYPEYEPVDKGYILVTGGTYGHRLLFETVDKLELDNIVLQTGRIDPRPFKERHPEWKVFQFDPDFGKWLAGASVVVSHLGKTVIDAVLTYRKPVVIVPNPEWTLTAGWEDARILAGKLNAVVVDDIKPEILLEAIEEARKKKPPVYQDGAEKLAEELLGLT